MKIIRFTFTLIFITATFVSCLSNSNDLNKEDQLTASNDNLEETLVTTSNEDESLEQESHTPKLNWRNPFMNPFGASVVNYLRAYYLTGQFEVMRKFLIGVDCYSQEEFAYKMSSTTWGYGLKATNLKWIRDSVFVLTCNSDINNTKGMEEYAGRIINDTAKIFFFSNHMSNPFVFHYDDDAMNNCEIHTLTKAINFEFNSSTLTPDAKKAIEKICQSLRRNKNNIVIEGHTSEEGTDEYNLNLSRKRAEAVRTYMAANGYSKSKLKAIGYGKTKPIYSTLEGEPNPLNRRVEIHFE